MALLVIGGLMAVIGWVMLLIAAFKDSVLWGLIVLFFSGIGGLVFTIVKKPGWTPILLMIGGGILAGIGSGMAAASMNTEPAAMVIKALMNLA
ncbi:hypothetical protein BH10BAC5_BH10BAC5_27200 [soil metagenome]